MQKRIYQIDGDYLQYIDGVVRANFLLYLSDYARIALAVAAAGGDARNVGGHDLIEAIAQTDFTREIYTDGVSFYCLQWIPCGMSFRKRCARPRWTRFAVHNGRKDGGFNYALRVNPEDLFPVDGSIDTTGPVLAALAPYQTEEKTAGVIERALAFLKANQNVETAGFGFMGSDSADDLDGYCRPDRTEDLTLAGRNM